MDSKKYFIEYKINDMQSFFNYARDSFKYGWMDQGKKFHQGVNDAENYCLQTPGELIESKIGICWDMTELYRYWFSIMTDLKQETYYIFYDDNMGCPSHSILVFYQDNLVFWFEPMFYSDDFNYSGIHQYAHISELLKDVKDVFIQYNILKKVIPEKYDESKIYLYKYTQPKYHINGYQMRNHINRSLFISG